ncbi:MAG: hypothetical protein J0I92_15810, partial [Phyllobacterium sp.]|nr:hypothetical protein [Phyllobacterium sp.]
RRLIKTDWHGQSGLVVEPDPAHARISPQGPATGSAPQTVIVDGSMSLNRTRSTFFIPPQQ